MDYLENVKKSLRMIWKHKWLWWLGILASLTSGGGNFNFNFYNFQGVPDIFKENGESTGQTSAMLGKVLGATTTGNQFQQILENIRNLFTNNIFWIVLIAFILLILGIVLFVISISARGGLISAVAKLAKKEETNFSESISSGFRRFFSLFGAGIIIALIILLGVILVAAPAIILGFIPGVGWIFSIAIAIIGLLFLMVLAIFAGFVSEFAFRVIMIEGMGAIEALRESYRLVRKEIVKVIIIWLINVLSSIVFGIATALLFLVLGLPLLFAGFGIAVLGGVVLVLYIIFAALLLLALGLFLSGVFHSYISAFWTLSYLEIKSKPQ